MSIAEEKKDKLPFARLCRTFTDQAGPMSLSLEDVWHDVSVHPWINSHPWEDNGVPEDFSDAVFNVQLDMRKAYVKMLEGYDPDTAALHGITNQRMARLLLGQVQEDIDYLLKECRTDQQLKVMNALYLLYEANVDDPKAPYYKTDVVINAYFMARKIETFLTRGYQAVYGPRNF